MTTLDDIISKYRGKITRLKTKYNLDNPDDSARDKALMRKRYEAFEEVITDLEKIDHHYNKIFIKAFITGMVFTILTTLTVYYLHTH